MKKIFTVLLLTMTTTVFAQINPPMGIEWSANYQSVSNIIENNSGEYLESGVVNSRVKYTMWTDANIGGTNYLIVGATFLDGKVIKMQLATTTTNSWFTLKRMYNNYVEIYSDKYGNGNELFEFFTPYYEGDGYEIQAFKMEKAVAISVFESNNDFVSVEIMAVDDGGYISITYEHDGWSDYLDSQKGNGL